MGNQKCNCNRCTCHNTQSLPTMRNLNRTTWNLVSCSTKYFYETVNCTAMKQKQKLSLTLKRRARLFGNLDRAKCSIFAHTSDRPSCYTSSHPATSCLTLLLQMILLLICNVPQGSHGALCFRSTGVSLLNVYPVCRMRSF